VRLMLLSGHMHEYVKSMHVAHATEDLSAFALIWCLCTVCKCSCIVRKCLCIVCKCLCNVCKCFCLDLVLVCFCA